MTQTPVAPGETPGAAGGTPALPFFYGWVIVALALLSAFWGTGAIQRAFAVILKPLTEDLGVPRTMGVLGVTIAALTGDIMSPLIGVIVDKRGPRLLMVVAGAIIGLSLIALSQVQSIWLFLLLFGVVLGSARPVLQAVGAQTTVAKWFVRRRGRAVTFSTLGMPLSAVVFIPLTQYLVSEHGWRSTWLVLGMALMLTLTIPAGIFMRGRPEDMGLLPDGDPAPGETPGAAGGTPALPGAPALHRPSQTEHSWTPREAFHSRPFWMLSIGFAIIGMVPSIMNIHMFPHFTDQGLSPELAAMANGSFGFWVIGSRLLVWGFVLERVPIERVMVLWAILETAAIAVMILVNNAALAFLAAGCFGLAMGGSAPLGTLSWARYFGRESLGTITGMANLVGIVNDVVGPIMPSLVYDFTGSYRGAFAATTVACFAGIVMFSLAGAPVAPRRAQSAQS